MTALSPKKSKIEINGTDYSNDVTNYTVSAADQDNSTLTFGEADSGATKAYTVTVTVIQDDSATSLWSYINDNAGTDNIPLVLQPHGNATPSATQPHWTGTCSIPEWDGDFMGGDANIDPRARWTASAAITISAKLTRLTA